MFEGAVFCFVVAVVFLLVSRPLRKEGAWSEGRVFYILCLILACIAVIIGVGLLLVI
jgi:NADH:ubiquinone oxidoreductase subunit K